MSYAFPLPIPVLETGRLILREPREADFAAALAFNDSPRNHFVGKPLAHVAAAAGQKSQKQARC